MLISGVVERFGLPGDGAGFRTPKGRLAIWTPAPGFVISRITGLGDKAFTVPIIDAFDRALPDELPIRLFFDVETIASYDSELRTQLTARFYEERARIGEFHVLVGSKLTAMGVSVANLALGGIVTSHTQRLQFVTAVDTALIHAKVVKFSSSMLFAE